MTRSEKSFETRRRHAVAEGLPEALAQHVLPSVRVLDSAYWTAMARVDQRPTVSGDAARARMLKMVEPMTGWAELVGEIDDSLRTVPQDSALDTADQDHESPGGSSSLVSSVCRQAVLAMAGFLRRAAGKLDRIVEELVSDDDDPLFTEVETRTREAYQVALGLLRHVEEETWPELVAVHHEQGPGPDNVSELAQHRSEDEATSSSATRLVPDSTFLLNAGLAPAALVYRGPERADTRAGFAKKVADKLRSDQEGAWLRRMRVNADEVHQHSADCARRRVSSRDRSLLMTYLNGEWPVQAVVTAGGLHQLNVRPGQRKLLGGWGGDYELAVDLVRKHCRSCGKGPEAAPNAAERSRHRHRPDEPMRRWLTDDDLVSSLLDIEDIDELDHALQLLVFYRDAAPSMHLALSRPHHCSQAFREAAARLAAFKNPLEISPVHVREADLPAGSGAR